MSIFVDIIIEDLFNLKSIFLNNLWKLKKFIEELLERKNIDFLLALSLFTGAWIVRDAKKYLIPKIITIPSLILTYFTGPVGLVIYWFFRIFFAKKISFND